MVWTPYREGRFSAAALETAAFTIFLYARQATADAYTIAAVDASQAAEVLFTLLGEIVLLGEPLPGPIGALGVALVIGGLVGFTLKSKTA